MIERNYGKVKVQVAHFDWLKVKPLNLNLNLKSV